MAINIFEPSLQVRHPLLDYEKLEIQGTFPRPHEIPTDVFPTYSVIAGVHVDRPVGKVATFTEDNELRVSNSGGGGGSVTPVKYGIDSLDYGISETPGQRVQDSAGQYSAIYAILCTWDVQGENTIRGSGWVDFSLQDSVAGNLLRLYRGSVSLLNPETGVGYGESKYIHFNPPIDTVLSGLNVGAGVVQMVIDNFTEQQLDTAMIVYHN